MFDYILKDKDGNMFLSISKETESSLAAKPQLTHCLAVVKIGDDYLLGWNKWRKRWEIFGGCLAPGETPRDCIIRECSEELGIFDVEFTYIGAMKFLLMPDYFCKEERIEFGGLYGLSLDGANVEDLQKQIQDRDEIVRLALYSDIKGREPIAQIDEKLLEFYN